MADEGLLTEDLSGGAVTKMELGENTSQELDSEVRIECTAQQQRLWDTESEIRARKTLAGHQNHENA